MDGSTGEVLWAPCFPCGAEQKPSLVMESSVSGVTRGGQMSRENDNVCGPASTKRDVHGESVADLALSFLLT